MQTWHHKVRVRLRRVYLIHTRKSGDTALAGGELWDYLVDRVWKKKNENLKHLFSSAVYLLWVLFGTQRRCLSSMVNEWEMVA